VKCPFCSSPNVEKVREWDMPKKGYHVTRYVCGGCGGHFNHYVGGGREFVLRVFVKRRKAAKRQRRTTSRSISGDTVSARVRISIPKTPPNIVAVDQFGGVFYVHDVEKSTEHPTAVEALQEAVRRAADRFAEAVVYFGEDKKLQEARLPPWISRDAVVNLAKKLEKYVEGSLSLAAIRREAFGETDLLELELAVSRSLPVAKTSEECRKLFRTRFETIAWLYSLYKRLSMETCSTS
jgi:hypothetical protein